MYLDVNENDSENLLDCCKDDTCTSLIVCEESRSYLFALFDRAIDKFAGDFGNLTEPIEIAAKSPVVLPARFIREQNNRN